tara:strand:- start:1409 stop:1723 length:315 start_codon:yes stop_codon:yes gene_type:complete
MARHPVNWNDTDELWSTTDIIFVLGDLVEVSVTTKHASGGVRGNKSQRKEKTPEKTITVKVKIGKKIYSLSKTIAATQVGVKHVSSRLFEIMKPNIKVKVEENV